MSDLDKKIFKNKRLSDLLEEIYNNQNRKADQVSLLINQLKPLIENLGDATLVVPLIKEYLEVGVKNDDLLIKMAVLAQKSLMSSSSEKEFGITEQEKNQLLEEARNLNSKSLE